MRALLDYVAVIEHQDAVRVLDRGKTVGDHEAGPALHKRADRLLHLAFGRGVNIAGCLVQDQHIVVVEHRPRDRQQLFLPFGDVAAVLTDDGVIALGQTHDGVVDARGLRRGDHLVKRGVLLAVGDVFKDRAVEDPGILQHHGIAAPQALARIGAAVALVNQHGSLIHVVKAHKQVDDCGFPCAGRTDNGDRLAGLCLQLQVMQDRLARYITKGHVLDLHMSAAILQRQRVGSVGAFLALFKQLEDALRRGERGEKLVDDVGDLGDRAGEFAAVQDKAGDLLKPYRAQQIERGAAHADGGETEVVDHADRRPHAHTETVRVAVGLGGLAVDGAELLAHGVLVGIGQDRLLPGEHFLGKAVHLAIGRAASGIERACLLAHDAGKEDRSRDRKGHAQHQRRRDDAHHRKAADDCDYARQDLDDVGGKTGADDVDVVRHAADDITGLVRVEIADRQPHELVEHVAPHVLRDASAHTGHAEVYEKAHDIAAHIGQQHQKSVMLHHGKIDLTRAGLGGADGLAREAWTHKVADVAEKGEDEKEQHKIAIGHQIADDAPQRAARVLWLGLRRSAVSGSRHVYPSSQPRSPIWI